MTKKCKSILDCAFEMLKWCLKEKYIKMSEKLIVDKIVFLDIDGVLNSEEWADKCFNKLVSDDICNSDIDPDAINRLIKFLDDINAKIVLSGSCRNINIQSTISKFSTPNYKLLKKLIPYIIGITPQFYKHRKRGNEISYWMNMLSIDYDDLVKHGCLLENVEISKNYRYVIVDDGSDMLRGQNFVQIDFQTGLTDEDVNEMKAFLEIHK